MAPIELLVIFRERTPVLTEAFSSALECNDYAKGMMTAQSDFLFFLNGCQDFQRRTIIRMSHEP